jgi:hypothetical protein
MLWLTKFPCCCWLTCLINDCCHAAVAREKLVTLKDVAVLPGDLTEEAMDTS